MSSPAVLSVFIWSHPYKSLSGSKVKTKLLLQYPWLGKHLVYTINYVGKLEIRVMKHLVSNQAKCLWLLETGSSAESQQRASSSLHLFSRKLRMCVFFEMTCMGSPHVALMSSKMKKIAAKILSAVQLYSVQPWEGWVVPEKEAKSNYLCIFYLSFTLLVPQRATSTYILFPNPQ